MIIMGGFEDPGVTGGVTYEDREVEVSEDGEPGIQQQILSQGLRQLNWGGWRGGGWGGGDMCHGVRDKK